MKKSLLRLAMLGLPVLFAASCGGDNLFGTLDGGTTGACPAGVTVYQISTGSYNPVAGSGAIVSDSCNTGFVAADVEKARKVSNDAQGNISVTSVDGLSLVGTGPVRCNTGTLTYESQFIVDGPCNYRYKNSVDFTVTSANTFGIVVTQTRLDSTSVAGAVCPQDPTSCVLKYSVNESK